MARVPSFNTRKATIDDVIRVVARSDIEMKILLEKARDEIKDLHKKILVLEAKTVKLLDENSPYSKG